jgi:hypothetical protein
MSNVYFSLFHKIMTLSLVILSVYWLINIWNINLWQQVLLEKTINKAPLVELQALELQESNKTVSNSGKSLVFAKIDLPEIPKTSQAEVSQTEMFQPKITQNKITNKNQVVKSQVSQKNIVSKKVTKNQKASLDQKSIQTVTQESTAVIYQQLISDNSINIELAWPNESSVRQGVFTFLYQCIGMKFGVLNNESITLAKTFYQSGNANDEPQPSEWLRITQGELASQERLWLKQYHLSGTPVRLFPKEVDWQLAKLISNQLNGKALKSLRAQYKYQHQRLLLTNIQLNGQRLSKNWTLIENQCSI